MNCLKSFRHAVFFVVALTFRCANASNSRQQRVPVTADPPAAVATVNFVSAAGTAGEGSSENATLLSAIVALPVAAAFVGVGVRIFAEECFGAASRFPRRVWREP